MSIKPIIIWKTTIKRNLLVEKRIHPRKSRVLSIALITPRKWKGHLSEKMTKVVEISKTKCMSRLLELRTRRTKIENHPIGRLGRSRFFITLPVKMLADEVIISIQFEKLLPTPEYSLRVWNYWFIIFTVCSMLGYCLKNNKLNFTDIQQKPSHRQIFLYL